MDEASSIAVQIIECQATITLSGRDNYLVRF
jgi:hypothetical protein